MKEELTLTEMARIGQGKEFNFIEELKKHIINEYEIQKAVAEGGIEFSYTGELVPLEIVQGKFDEFIRRLKEPLFIDKNKSYSANYVLSEMVKRIDKLAGNKPT